MLVRHIARPMLGSIFIVAGTLVPATLTDQAFWRQPDPDLKLQQKTHFWKNISILGGLIIAGIDTEGRPGLSWRTRKAAGDAVAAISSALPGVEPASHSLQAKAAELGEVAREKVPEIASRRGGELAERISERGADMASAAESGRRRWLTR